MELTGSYYFQSPPDRVFSVMTDPAVVSSCLPGCESFEPAGGNRYKVILSMGVAAITGRYEGIVEMKDLVPPVSYRLAVAGKGKPGFVNGEGSIELAAEEDGTRVLVKGTATIGGAIARVGQRLTAGVAKMMMDKFFACLESKL
jgi:uncharacterized protein